MGKGGIHDGESFYHSAWLDAGNTFLTGMKFPGRGVKCYRDCVGCRGRGDVIGVVVVMLGLVLCGGCWSSEIGCKGGFSVKLLMMAGGLVLKAGGRKEDDSSNGEFVIVL